MVRPLYVPTQPKRCAGGETGAAGHCLACGQPAGGLCIAPPDERPKAKRRGQSA